jgi:putative transposase
MAKKEKDDNKEYRAVVYAIYPNKKQKEQLAKTFGCCRFVYNKILDLQQENYANGGKHLSFTTCNDYCNQVLKKEYPWLAEVDKFSLSNSIKNLNEAYQRFFDHTAKFPKRKTRHKSKKSYTTNITNDNIKVNKDSIQLPKLGDVKAKVHRVLSSEWIIKHATVRQNPDGTYQVSVCFARERVIIKPADVNEDNAIGLDYKSDGLYVDSNGNTCGMEHYFRKSQKRLAKEQRRLSRKAKGSKNYEKQRLKVAKVHHHIANQREDFLQKQSTAIAKQYSCVCVEDLNMRSMSNKGFGNGKATLDNGYGMFLKYLEYKLNDSGGCLIKVDRFYPSSQLCQCGFKNPITKDLRVRTVVCPECGSIYDRDVNAAINIKSEGLRIYRSLH